MTSCGSVPILPQIGAGRARISSWRGVGFIVDHFSSRISGSMSYHIFGFTGTSIATNQHPANYYTNNSSYRKCAHQGDHNFIATPTKIGFIEMEWEAVPWRRGVRWFFDQAKQMTGICIQGIESHSPLQVVLASSSEVMIIDVYQSQTWVGIIYFDWHFASCFLSYREKLVLGFNSYVGLK